MNTQTPEQIAAWQKAPKRQYGNGFAFYRSGGKSDDLLPPDGASAESRREWIKGFCSVLADELLGQVDTTIQAELLHHGIDGDLLADLLDAADAVVSGSEWCRWPNVPVRGWPGDALVVRGM